MNREDFEILNDGLIYFDNAATTLKPVQVVNKIVEYYTKYTANAHRGDYDNSLKVDMYYEDARTKVKEFINAEKDEEIVFTKGSSESFNMIVFGFASYYLKKDDEVILTKDEHASNVLPWIVLSKKIGFKIKYADLSCDYELTVQNLEKVITDKTKIISIAHITNTIGDVRPVVEIGNICKKKGIIFILDATQSIGHMKVDVQKFNVTFLGFSALIIALTTDNPDIPVSSSSQALSNVIPPIATTGIFIDSTISFKSFFVIEGASSLVAVGKTAPVPI